MYELIITTQSGRIRRNTDSLLQAKEEAKRILKEHFRAEQLSHRHTEILSGEKPSSNIYTVKIKYQGQEIVLLHGTYQEILTAL